MVPRVLRNRTVLLIAAAALALASCAEQGGGVTAWAMSVSDSGEVSLSPGDDSDDARESGADAAPVVDAGRDTDDSTGRDTGARDTRADVPEVEGFTACSLATGVPRIAIVGPGSDETCVVFQLAGGGLGGSPDLRVEPKGWGLERAGVVRDVHCSGSTFDVWSSARPPRLTRIESIRGSIDLGSPRSLPTGPGRIDAVMTFPPDESVPARQTVDTAGFTIESTCN